MKALINMSVSTPLSWGKTKAKKYESLRDALSFYRTRDQLNNEIRVCGPRISELAASLASKVSPSEITPLYLS